MDIIKSMKPFIKVSQFCGLFPYKVQKSFDFCFLTESAPLLKYGKVLYWFLALSEGSSIVSSNFALDYSDHISTQLVLLLSTMTLYLSFIIIFRTVVKKRSILCFWINQFNRLCIHSKVNSRKLERFNSFLLLGSSFYFCLIVVTKFVTDDPMSGRNLLLNVVFFARLWVIHLFLKHFVVFANFIRCFYFRVHTELRKANHSEFAEVLNSIYTPVLLVHFMWFFVTLLCDIAIAGRGGMPTVMQIYWMVYICVETILYTTVCHKTGKEERKTIWWLQNLLLHLDDPALLSEMELLSLQLQHIDLNFNVLGFFVLDYTLLYSMIGATSTYTFILLQFQTDHRTKFREDSGRNVSSFAVELFNTTPVATNIII